MLRKTALLTAVVILALSCNKSPLGEDELAQRGTGSPEFVIARIDSFETCYIAPGQGTSLNLVLGRDQEYQSRILLNFSYPDTVSSDMEDIRLTLYKRKFPRDDTFEFNLHVLTTAWAEDNATWRLADAGLQWYRPGGDYETDPLVSKSAVGDSVVIRFTRDNLETMKAGQGVILVPSGPGFTTFYSREGAKPVRLTYKKGDDRLDIPLSGDAHIIVDSLPEPFRKLWLGAGIPFRPFLRFSGTDTLLRDKKIVYGLLRISKSFARSQRDTIDITLHPLFEAYRGFDTKHGSALVNAKVALGDSSYELDVINLLQYMAYHADSNYGFFLKTSPDNYDITRLEFRTDPIEIEVGYISPPEVR